MKRLYLSLAAAVAMLSGLVSASSANDWFRSGASNDVYASTTQLPLVAIGDCSGGCACDDGCCDSYCRTIIADVELSFLKYGQEGGVTDADGDLGSFDSDIAPRVTLGVVRDDGFGVRGRLWVFDHSTLSQDGDPIAVDTYTIDSEFFQVIDLCNGTSLDMAAGVRYLNFDILLGAATSANFHGFGPTVGLHLRKDVLSGNVYAKSRLSIVVDDLTSRDPGLFGTTLGLDHPVTQVELGVGYEVVRCLDSGTVLRLRAGIESQQWLSIVPMDPLGFGFGNDDVVADASFFGFTTGIGIDY